jgi:hypothetical protein
MLAITRFVSSFIAVIAAVIPPMAAPTPIKFLAFAAAAPKSDSCFLIFLFVFSNPRSAFRWESTTRRNP